MKFRYTQFPNTPGSTLRLHGTWYFNSVGRYEPGLSSSDRPNRINAGPGNYTAVACGDTINFINVNKTIIVSRRFALGLLYIDSARITLSPTLHCSLLSFASAIPLILGDRWILNFVRVVLPNWNRAIGCLPIVLDFVRSSRCERNESLGTWQYCVISRFDSCKSIK